MKTRLGWPPRVGQSKEGNYTNNTNLSFFFKEKKKRMTETNGQKMCSLPCASGISRAKHEEGLQEEKQGSAAVAGSQG